MSSATLTLISHRGREFFDKARAIAELSDTDKGFVQVAVFLAGASVEAFVNELQDGVSRDTNGDARFTVLGAELLKLEVERKSIFKKVARIYQHCGATLDKKDGVYQNFDHLVTLRNAIAHPRVQTGNSTAVLELDPMLTFLLQAGVLGKEDLQGHVTWDRAIRTSKVAHWAATTAERFIQHLVAMVPVVGDLGGSLKDQLQVVWDDL